VTFSNNKDISNTSGEFLATTVLEVDDIETSWMLIMRLNNSNSTNVGTTSDSGQLTNIKFKMTIFCLNFTVLDVDSDSVIDSDKRIWLANGSAIVSYDEWDHSLMTSVEWVSANGGLLGVINFDDLAKFVFCFFISDTMENEAAFDIIQHTEALIGLVDGDNILKTARIIDISANFAINFNKTTSSNYNNLTSCQGKLQTVAKDQRQRKAFPKLMGTSGWPGSPNAAKFGEHPSFRGTKPF